MANELPEFIQVGHDEHPLGKRSIWLYPDGSAEVLSEAFGLTATFEFSRSQGPAAIEELKRAYAEHDEVRGA